MAKAKEHPMQNALSKFFNNSVKDYDTSDKSEADISSVLVEEFLINVLNYPKDIFKREDQTKAGKKVDILIEDKDKNPIIITEVKKSLVAKVSAKDYTKYQDQLLHYMITKSANAPKPVHWGILTDGCLYDFYYRDGDKYSLVFRLDMDSLTSEQEELEFLSCLAKDTFNPDRAKELAEEARDIDKIRKFFREKFLGDDKNLPTIGNDKDCLFLGAFWDQLKRPRERQPADFGTRVNKAIAKFRLIAAETQESDVVANEGTSGIATTQEEIQAHLVVRAILAEYVDINRITCKDTATWFAVQLDNDRNKTIVRFELRKTVWHVNFAHDGWDNTTKKELLCGGNFQKLYTEYRQDLIDSLNMYLKQES